ncbi:glycosyltransferase family 4 protein [Paenibacillus allorhizosphaerae]|uniref:D-inositol-3-phosphate glycosyltransferase n=1 Tax=Paenibacillus allorhizosphaerae TaxID=2849866 RepID=A0ABN7TIG8_9BACL|nr:glycosyltransferase family 4 protein [Paenibacillus allorhizosphaerae]CAG7632417.1 D-inositol-3-phosphate glycosyltransferase [Paenibacillus allorhizosphaerae]
MHKVLMGCSAGLGEGGLGGHLNFVYESVRHSGGRAEVFTSSSAVSGSTITIPAPSWQKWIKYTPVRWLPATKVYWDTVHFDRYVSEKLPSSPVIYHTFPGYAENSFRKVRRFGGITVLEAATTHVAALFSDTSLEHRTYKMKGSPFHPSWVERVLREYELADYITVASRMQMDSFLRQGMKPEKLLFAPLGVDTKRFHPLPGQASLVPRMKGEPFRIISVGQVSLLKGVPYVLEAVKRTGDPEIEITLFGGIGWRKIRSLIEQYQQAGVRIKLGAGDPIPSLRNSHLCVHAAVNDGFGLAPLEAMATGIPTIVSDATGMKDAIEQGRSGLITPARDAGALAEQILRLKHDDDYRIHMAEASITAAQQYDIQERVAYYAQLLSPVWSSIQGERSG